MSPSKSTPKTTPKSAPKTAPKTASRSAPRTTDPGTPESIDPGIDPGTPESIDAPETEEVASRRVACDGSGPGLGHPRVWLMIGDSGWVDCPYCDKRFLLKKGAGGH